jgi:hypothetical protein
MKTHGVQVYAAWSHREAPFDLSIEKEVIANTKGKFDQGTVYMLMVCFLQQNC